jgi:hypothetical protein
MASDATAAETDGSCSAPSTRARSNSAWYLRVAHLKLGKENVVQPSIRPVGDLYMP